MSIAKTFLDQARLVPEKDETGWGPEVTDQLVDLLDGADFVLALDGSSNFLVRLQAATSSLAAGATLTPTKPVHKVVGNPGAVTLGGIAAGAKDGQVLILVGTDDAKPVSLVHAGNLVLNGDITLGAYDVLRLAWDATGSKWYELGRNS